MVWLKVASELTYPITSNDMKQEDIQKVLEVLGKGGINVAGDFVVSKHVEYEVNNVETGGIGIQIVNGKEVQQNDGDTRLPKELDTARARKCFAKALELQYMEADGNGRYRWIGTNNKGVVAELAYFLGRVYNYRHSVSGNRGEDFPEESLNRLFGVTRLYSSLTQVYNAQKPQRWRSLIDAIFD